MNNLINLDAIPYDPNEERDSKLEKRLRAIEERLFSLERKMDACISWSDHWQSEQVYLGQLIKLMQANDLSAQEKDEINWVIAEFKKFIESD